MGMHEDLARWSCKKTREGREEKRKREEEYIRYLEEQYNTACCCMGITYDSTPLLAWEAERELNKKIVTGSILQAFSELATYRSIGSTEQCQEAMERLNGWIACEDRLPELNHFYAVTIFDGEDYRVEPAYYAKIGCLGMRELKPNWWTDCTSNSEMIEDGEDKVLAWQPLPEPYRP